MCSTHSVSFATEDFIVVVSIVWVTGAKGGIKEEKRVGRFSPTSYWRLPHRLFQILFRFVHYVLYPLISESDQHQFSLNDINT